MDGRYYGPLYHKNGVMVGSGQEGHLEILAMAEMGEAVVQGVINAGGGGGQPPPLVGHNKSGGRAHTPHHQENWPNGGGRKGQADLGHCGPPPPHNMGIRGNIPRHITGYYEN